MRYWRRILPALVCLACAPAAWSYPTCINLVPTAETVGAHTLSVQWEAESGGTPMDGESTHYVFTQLGLTDRLEVGLDLYEVGKQSRLYGNAKFVLLEEKRGLPAVAAGIWNLSRGMVSEPYFMASRSLGNLGLHAGTVRSGGKWEAAGGLCASVTERWCVQADILSGIGGYTTYGTSYTLAGNLDVTLYHARYRDREADADYTGLNLSWEKALFE